MKSEQSFAGMNRNIITHLRFLFFVSFTRNREWIRSLWLTGISEIGFDERLINPDFSSRVPRRRTDSIL